MSSNEVVKSVAKKLKYYFEIKRLEDGFDLSDVHQPQLDHPPLKTRPALQYDGLHDRALKHYFSQPEVRVQLTQLNGPNARGSLHGQKEIQVRKMLDNYMKHYSFQNNSLPSCYYYHNSKGCKQKSTTNGVMLNKRKKQKNLLGGWPVLRSVPDQYISKGEASRLINSATKILVASNGTRRPATAKFSHETSHKKRHRVPPKAYDDMYLEKRHVRQTPEPARARSPTPSQTTTATTATATSTTVSAPLEEKIVTRPRSAKYRSRTVINVPERQPQEEVAVIRSTQTAADYDVGLETDRQILEKFDKLEEEVKDGPWCEYQIYVCTGSRIGAGTKASIKLIMYGEKGRTKEFALSDSKRHKIPFQKGREDLFILPAHHIGRIRKVQIGHDRPELNFAWFLEGVTVFDMHARRIFQFPCERWLSGQDGDKRTYRILQVDRERDFIDALDESMSKSPRGQAVESDGSESTSTLKDDLRYRTSKANDNYSTQVRPGDAAGDSESDSESSKRGSRSSDGSEAKIQTRDQSKKTKKKVKDDYEDKAKVGTVITLHSGPDSQQVDQIYMDPNGKKTAAKTAEEYLEGYKAALSVSEEEKKKQLAREREMERSLLRGKSIHDAVRDSDMERVKDLLHHFPEMRDFRDESSWTPMHIAASRGDIPLLRWLVTSDADISAETSTGYNAMHIAAMNGHVNAMILLQAMGASIFGVTADKQSALHLAAKNGHLECIKWLVANRASLMAEDSTGRTALKLAEDFGHDASANFLRMCMRELSNPKSTFAMLHGRRISGSGLQTIDEDTNSTSSGQQWKDDIDVKGHSASDSDDERKNKKRTKAEEKQLEEKRRIYDEQHHRMEERGVSFLDSIRQDVGEE